MLQASAFSLAIHVAAWVFLDSDSPLDVLWTNRSKASRQLRTSLPFLGETNYRQQNSSSTRSKFCLLKKKTIYIILYNATMHLQVLLYHFHLANIKFITQETNWHPIPPPLKSPLQPTPPPPNATVPPSLLHLQRLHRSCLVRRRHSRFGGGADTAAQGVAGCDGEVVDLQRRRKKRRRKPGKKGNLALPSMPWWDLKKHSWCFLFWFWS